MAERHGLYYLPFNPIADTISFGKATLHMYMDSMKPGYDPYDPLVKCMERAEENVVEMFVCHPCYLDAYILEKSSLTIPRVLEVEMCCSERTKKYLRDNEISLVTYNDLAG